MPLFNKQPYILISIIVAIIVGFIVWQSTIASTDTFYPSLNGYVQNQVTNQGSLQANWDAVHDAATANSAGSYSDGTTSTLIYAVADDFPADIYGRISRGFLMFDTSSLPDNAIISTTTLNILGVTKVNMDNDGNDFLVVLQANNASTTELLAEDFDQCGDAIDNPNEGSERIDLGNITTTNFTSWTLNATGTSWVSKTGFTKLCIREGHDVLDNAVNGVPNQLDVHFVQHDDPAQRPYLQIIYETPASTVPTSTASINNGRININNGRKSIE